MQHKSRDYKCILFVHQPEAVDVEGILAFKHVGRIL